MVSASYNPLKLYRLIEQVVLKQTKDQYPFAAVHNQSLAMLNNKQGGLSNTQWYEHFNMQHDVARSVGVELGHKVLWEYCAQSKHSMSYDTLGTTNKAAMHQAAEDQYLAYILLVNSSGQHELLDMYYTQSHSQQRHRGGLGILLPSFLVLSFRSFKYDEVAEIAH